MKLVLALLLCVASVLAIPELVDNNPEYANLGEDFFEGDMRKGGAEGDDRNMMADSRLRWPKKNGIVYVPYVFEGSQTAGAKDMVAAAIKDYARWTCVKFVPRSRESDYISIKNGNDGCWSYCGKTGGKQPLSLSPGCVSSKGTPTHEMMHALGFKHEQAREDRDNYVRIIESNMKPGCVSSKGTPTNEMVYALGFKHEQAREDRDNYVRIIESNMKPGQSVKYQFKKCVRPQCVLPRQGYDYDSVMHYTPTAFSGNGKPTIEPRQSGAKFGQRAGMSAGDMKKINEMYSCNGKTLESNRGLTIPSKEAFDKYSNCQQMKPYCKQSHIKAGCPVTCA